MSPCTQVHVSRTDSIASTNWSTRNTITRSVCARDRVSVAVARCPIALAPAAAHPQRIQQGLRRATFPWAYQEVRLRTCRLAAALAKSATNGVSEPASSQGFFWAEQWYPVGFLVDLPTHDPIPFSLFDHKLVVWYQGNGRWGCMDDECPHRRAPLSRGRLCQASPPTASSGPSSEPRGPSFLLECAYHGWQFNGAGACVQLPQLLPPGYDKPAGTAASAAAGARPPRACSGRAYPTAVAQGMVWVWYGSVGGGCGGGGGVPPDESRIPLDFAEQGIRRGEDWALVDVFTRDFPYDWETMVENVVDPSHVAFAHDGTGQGLDRHAAPPLELQITCNGPDGFIGRFRGIKTVPSPPSPPHQASSTVAASASASAPAGATASSASAASTGAGVPAAPHEGRSTATAPHSPSSPTSASVSFHAGAWSHLEFRAPCLVSMRFSLPGKGDAGLVLYCVPLGRGRSRMIARLPRNFATGWRAALQPRWAKHLPRMAVLDQDIDLLREQEAAMAVSKAKLAWQQQQRQKQRQQQAGQGQEQEGQAEAEAARDHGSANWRSLYVMPAPADRFVVQFRRWLDKAGDSRPWALPESCTAALALGGAAAASGDPLPRERVLDRYHSHVRSCSACSGALACFQRLAAVARLAALMAVAAAAGLAAVTAAAGAAAAAPALAAPLAASAAAAAAGLPLAAAAAALATAAAGFGLLAAWCEAMVRRFHYTEEGRELRMNEDRWLRRLLFTGTNSFNSMVALTNKQRQD